MQAPAECSTHQPTVEKPVDHINSSVQVQYLGRGGPRASKALVQSQSTSAFLTIQTSNYSIYLFAMTGERLRLLAHPKPLLF